MLIQTPLYSKLNEAVAFAQLYKEPPKQGIAESDSSSKAILYSNEDINSNNYVEKGVKLYEGKSTKSSLKTQDPQPTNGFRVSNILY